MHDPGIKHWGETTTSTMLVGYDEHSHDKIELSNGPDNIPEGRASLSKLLEHSLSPRDHPFALQQSSGKCGQGAPPAHIVPGSCT